MTAESSVPPVAKVLILNADRLRRETICETVAQHLPGARVMAVSLVREAQEAHEAYGFDFFIMGVAFADGDVLDFLEATGGKIGPPPRVLAVVESLETRVLESMQSLAIPGLFDPATEGLHELARAICLVASGRTYWSLSALASLSRSRAAEPSLTQMLTLAEQRVLAIIGDGSDNKTAARELGVSVASIQSARREIHRKCGLRHRGELVRLAALHGFVRFTPAGVVRPGFSRLLAPQRGSRHSSVANRDHRSFSVTDR